MHEEDGSRTKEERRKAHGTHIMENNEQSIAQFLCHATLVTELAEGKRNTKIFLDTRTMFYVFSNLSLVSLFVSFLKNRSCAMNISFHLLCQFRSLTQEENGKWEKKLMFFYTREMREKVLAVHRSNSTGVEGNR